MSEQHDEEDESAEDEFRNNHDLIGLPGILLAQKTEIDKKKLELRIQNELYFR